MKPDSELCLRVAAQLAIRGGHGPLVEFSCPDDPANTRTARPGEKFIDLIATADDGTVLALEHTTIESYEQQLHEARQAVSRARSSGLNTATSAGGSQAANAGAWRPSR